MSSTSQEKINQIPLYYALNSRYLYASNTVSLVSLYVPFISKKIKQFQHEC